MLTDKGGEVVSSATKAWYTSQGIEPRQVGPKSAQLKLCERPHHTCGNDESADGARRITSPPLAKSNEKCSVRAKPRVQHRIPYGMMFGIRPDADHIRKLRALAYVYVSVPPRRLKRHDTSKAGFMLGFADGVY